MESRGRPPSPHEPGQSRQPEALSLQTLLERSSWYPELDAAARRQVLLDMDERSVAAGKAFIRHGERLLWWPGVMEGLLKWSSSTPSGRTVTLGGLTVGGWFGEGSVMRDQPVDAEIVALRFSRVALLPRDTFEWLIDTQPTFSRFLLHQINERMQWLMGSFIARLQSVEARVARGLVGLVHPWLHPGGQRHLQISQEELAHLAGLSRQRCNQALKRFEAGSLIRIGYGGLTLVDLPGLQVIASGD